MIQADPAAPQQALDDETIATRSDAPLLVTADNDTRSSVSRAAFTRLNPEQRVHSCRFESRVGRRRRGRSRNAGRPCSAPRLVAPCS